MRSLPSALLLQAVLACLSVGCRKSEPAPPAREAARPSAPALPDPSLGPDSAAEGEQDPGSGGQDPQDEAAPEGEAEASMTQEESDAETEAVIQAMMEAQAELDKELTHQPFDQGKVDDTAAVRALLGRTDVVEYFRKAFGAPFEPAYPSAPHRFFVGDFDADGDADLALYAGIPAASGFRPRPGIRIWDPLSDYMAEKHPDYPARRTRSNPDTGLAGLYPARGHLSFEGLAMLHGPFPAGGPGSMHLLYSSHFPQDLYLWKSDSTGHNPRWLKGASIFTIGEGQGDGYLYHSGGTYRYQMTQVGD